MSKQKSGYYPIVVLFNWKKARAIRRVCGIAAATLMSNQNGKPKYNSDLGNQMGLTKKEVELIVSILPIKAAKRRLARQAKKDAKKSKPHNKKGVNQPAVDNTTKPPKKK